MNPVLIKALYITNLGILDNLAQTQIVPYLVGLSEKGIKIYILSFEKKENLLDRARFNIVEKRLKELDIRWERLFYHSRWGNIWDIFLGFVRTMRIVKKERIAILHARSSIPILIAWPIAKILRRKIIYDRRGTMAGDFVDDVNVKNIFSITPFSSLLDKIDNFLIKHSSATIVLSERARNILKKNKWTTAQNPIIEDIPCCTNMTDYDNAGRDKRLRVDLNGRFVMCYLGSLGTCYLLREMAEFFKVIKSKKDNALFLIISHSEKRFIEGVLKKEGLEPKIDYVIINLNPEEVPAHVERCNFSVMFIKPVLCKIGSSPTKFGESLACGLPVVVNKGIGDTEKIILNNRVGAIVGDFTQFHYRKSFDLLEALLEDKALSERCRVAAKNYFSLKCGIDKYYMVYERLINKDI